MLGSRKVELLEKGRILGIERDRKVVRGMGIKDVYCIHQCPLREECMLYALQHIVIKIEM